MKADDYIDCDGCEHHYCHSESRGMGSYETFCDCRFNYDAKECRRLQDNRQKVEEAIQDNLYGMDYDIVQKLAGIGSDKWSKDELIEHILAEVCAGYEKLIDIAEEVL
jgi:hypothetical protein